MTASIKISRQKLRSCIGVLLSVCLILFSCGCSRGRDLAPQYTKSFFEADIMTEGFKRDISAHITVTAPDAYGKRGYTFLFTSPESVRGMTLSTADGEGFTLDLKIGQCTLPSGLAPIPSEIIAMLFPTSSIISIKSANGGDFGLEVHRRLTVVETETCLICIDSESELPLKVMSGDKSVSIIHPPEVKRG